MLHMISARCVAHDLHTTALEPLDHTCWRQFAAQWLDRIKFQIAISVRLLTLLLLLVLVSNILKVCALHFGICTCSAQLSTFYMERCNRYKIVITIIIIIIITIIIKIKWAWNILRLRKRKKQTQGGHFSKHLSGCPQGWSMKSAILCWVSVHCLNHTYPVRPSFYPHPSPISPLHPTSPLPHPSNITTTITKTATTQNTIIITITLTPSPPPPLLTRSNTPRSYLNMLHLKPTRTDLLQVVFDKGMVPVGVLQLGHVPVAHLSAHTMESFINKITSSMFLQREHAQQIETKETIMSYYV